MAGQVRALRRRIRSTRSTKKITKAMELVATSRIAKAQERVAASQPYADSITRVLTALATNAHLDHPLLVGRDPTRRAGVLVITSDRGLAGGYNANIQRLANQRLQEISDAGHEPMLFVVGRKGRDFFRFRGRDVAQSWTGFSELPAYENAVSVADSLAAAFLAGGEGTIEGPEEDEDPTVVAPEEVRGLAGVDELHVVFTAFSSMLSQTPEARQIAPLSLEELDTGDSDDRDSDDAGSDAEYDFEPEAEQLFDVLLPKYLRTRIFAALLDAAASESAARRRAMKAATDNANELIEDLTREANQARQAQITQEISEIVGGADALASQGSD
jgi:F-type H+-transporting ATPase subunit gamma